MSSADRRITVVSGLPRSGTSLMMRMLEAGGIDPVTDGVRSADSDNPRGYYELEAVKRTDKDASWVDRAGGKAVKVISQLLPTLPSGHEYDVIFMRRKLDEVLASQTKMLDRRGEGNDVSDDEIRMSFARHVDEIERHMRSAEHIRVLFVSYNRLMEKPEEQAQRIASFLDGRVEITPMLEVVEPSLYRNRA